MNMFETNRLLTVIAATDGRSVDDATVSVWSGFLGDLPLDECMEAVRRHYLKSASRVMPAHIREQVLAIREERRPRHEVLAIPSRFEDDDERAQRVRRGIAACVEALSFNRERHQQERPPEAAIEDAREISRQRAIARARRERAGQRA